MTVGKILSTVASDVAKLAQSGGRTTKTTPLRLGKLFKKGINYSSRTYYKMLWDSSEQIVGNLPTDILHAAVQQPNKGQIIKKIQQGFANAAEALSGFSDIQTQKILENLDNLDNLPGFLKRVKMGFEGYCPNVKKETVGIFERAHNAIFDSMKHLLPEGAQVRIKHIGSGQYGDAFKIMFFDKNDKKIFKDLVLKQYKAPQDVINSCKAQGLLTLKSRLNMTETELSEAIHNYCKKAGRQAPTEKEIGELVKELKQSAPEEIAAFIGKKEKAPELLSTLHGALPEGNVTQFIKRAIGHKVKETEGIALPYMFGYGKHQFALAPFVSKKVPKVKTPFELSKIGIKSGDTVAGDNTIAGRIIDMGGMVVDGPNSLLLDKTILKYFRKIVNRPSAKQAAEIAKYEELALQTKDLTLKKKILTAIGLAEKHLTQHA